MTNKAHKILLLSIGLLWSAHAEAQFSKGAILLDANVNYFARFKDKNAPKELKSPYQFGIGATAGYMLNAQDELGVGIGYNSNRDFSFDNPFFRTLKSSSVNPSIFWRHYSRLGERFSFASGISFAGRFGKSDYQDLNTGIAYETSFTNLSAGYTPSLIYQITSKLGVRGNLGQVGFNFNKSKDQENWGRSFQMDFSPQNFNFGIFLLLNGTE